MNDVDISLLLARASEGKLSVAEVEALKSLMVTDPTLSDALSGILEIDGLEQAGALTPPTTEEAEVMLSQMHELMLDATEGVAAAGETEPNLEEDDDDPVRSGAVLASISGGEDIQDMNPIADQRQQAIDSVFGMASAEPAAETVGKPGSSDLFSLDVKQEYMDNCAIKCQQLILEEFGIEVSAEELARMSFAHGWYMPGSGTVEEDVGKILQAYGIDITRYENANVFNLVSELAQGRQIIIAVDSGELWSSNEILKDIATVHPELFEDGIADHAVIVSGVDISDPNNPIVVITDPGTGQVAGEYPMADFLDAWEDSGFQMVATNVSPEQFAAAHVDSIGDIPYDDFARLYPQVAGLTGSENYFDQLCEVFRQQLHNPMVDAMTDLFQLVPGFQPSQLGDDAAAQLGHEFLADSGDGPDTNPDDNEDDLI